VSNKIILKEDPATPDLGSRYLSGLRALPQFLRVHAQEVSCFREVEGTQREALRAIRWQNPILDA